MGFRPFSALKQLDFRGPSVAWISAGWRLLSGLPGGARLYSKLLGAIIPYTGSIDASVLTLEPGRAIVRLEDRRAVRNHVGSVHAIALSNLAELAGNAALAASLPETGRFIVKRLEIDYLKKARGPITAECRCEASLGNTRREVPLVVTLSDASGEVVARANLLSVIGPIPKQA